MVLDENVREGETEIERETLVEVTQTLAFIQYLPSFIWATGVIENNHRRREKCADKLYMRDDV